MRAPDFDIVLYGATGFTGRQTVEYMARHAPGKIRWAIAGRDRVRLEHLRQHLGEPVGADDVLVADSRDQDAVDAIVSRTRVLLSTAGPFSLYGSPVVDACVRHRTHYVDITGETPWVREMIARHHDHASADGTRIIPFCGFDSVPSDLGAFLVVRQMQQALGVACAEVRAFFQLKGGVNGGTIATMLNGAKSGRLAGMGDPFLLDPASVPYQRQKDLSRDLRAPRYDAELGAWVGPFVMAPVNTRVVRRSAALYAQWGEPYGPEFVYQESAKFSPPLARAKAVAATAALGLFAAALSRPLSRRALERVLPKPGTGPSEDAMNQGRFKCELLGFASDGRTVRGVVRHQGDPGNRATVRFVCESALGLAVDADELPGGRERGGVLTPATGLGHVLARRLRQAGVGIEVGNL